MRLMLITGMRSPVAKRAINNRREDVRRYEVYACRDVPGQWIPGTSWSVQVVTACGIAQAWDEVRKLGWWPVSLVGSDWAR